MTRETLIRDLRNADAFTTEEAATVWNVSKVTARRRLLKMEVTGTNTNSSNGRTGRVDGRYIDTVWQVNNSEDEAMIERVVSAFFPA